MMSFLRKLFSTPRLQAMNDPDFGRIGFFPSKVGGARGIWQTIDDGNVLSESARLGFCSIPGDLSGPFAEARAFLLGKRDLLKEVWEQAAPALEGIRAHWRPDTAGRPLREVFVLTSLGMEDPIADPPVWEVSFEPRDGAWIFASVCFEGAAVIATSCDT